MAETVYSVGQLNTYIKNMFTQDYLLQSLKVQGEISNCKYHSSGHIYFTLKDRLGAIACVMFAGNARGLRFRLQDGMQVVVQGNVDIYERDGKYQLYAKSISQNGEGQLYALYEALKKELEEEGMFAPQYKQPIPAHVRTLGVVTASTGAAVRDIINVASRRNPYVQIILYPAIVQGADAAPSIVRGIRALEQIGVDVMIVGRGGGSIEDLWAFNEREVAQAVFDCSVPIISAVGHETDFTIIDFVSDLRAPTPSAAAELAVREFSEVEARLSDAQQRLQNAMLSAVRKERNRLAAYERQLQILSPEAMVRRSRQDLIRREEALEAAMEKVLLAKKNRLALTSARLEGASPLKRLQSGYAYVAGADGKKIISAKEVAEGDALHLYVTDGRIDVRTEKIALREEDGESGV